jgi:hypothetical protein
MKSRRTKTVYSQVLTRQGTRLKQSRMTTNNFRLESGHEYHFEANPFFKFLANRIVIPIYNEIIVGETKLE